MVQCPGMKTRRFTQLWDVLVECDISIESHTQGFHVIIIIIIITTIFMVLSSWQSHCESSLGSLDECRMLPSGRRPKTKPDDLGCESACTGCQKLHPPSPFIIITQPESWYSFYHPTEGRRLSRPSWLVTYGYDITGPQTVTHPDTNRVWRSATTLIEANAFPLSQTANRRREFGSQWW